MFSKVTTATVFARNRLYEEQSLERQDSYSSSNVFPPRKRDAQLEAAFDQRKVAVRKAMSYLTDREKEETGGEWDLARRKLEADRARQYLEDKAFEKIQQVQATERKLEKELLYEKVIMENDHLEKEQAAAQKRERQRQQELELQKEREYLMHVTNFDDTGLLWPPNMPMKMRHPRGCGSREDSIEFYSSDDSDDEGMGGRQQLQSVESPPAEEPVIMGHLARAMMRAEERAAESLASRPDGLTRAWKTPETTAEIHHYGVRTLPLAAGKVTSPPSGSDQMTSPEGPSGDELSSNDEGRKVKFGRKNNGKGVKSSLKSSGSDGSSTEGILKNNGKSEIPHGGARPKTKLLGTNVDEAYKKKQVQNSKSHKLSPRVDHRGHSPDIPIYKAEKKTDKLFGFTLGQSDIERGYMHHMGLDVLNVDPDDSTNWKEKVQRHERNMAMAAQTYPLSSPSHYSDIQQVTVDVHASETSDENNTLQPEPSPTSPRNIMEVPGDMDVELEELHRKFCERHHMDPDQPLEIIEADDRIYEDITKEIEETKEKAIVEETKTKSIIEEEKGEEEEEEEEEEEVVNESLKRTGSGRQHILKSPKTTREGPILVPPSVMKEAIKSHGIVGVMSTRVGIPEADEGKASPGTVLFTPTIIPEPTIINSPLEHRHGGKRRDSARSRIPSVTDSRTSRRQSESGDLERKGSYKSKDGRDSERRGSRVSRRASDSEGRGSRRPSESSELERRGSTRSKDGRLPSQAHDLERCGSGKNKTKLTREHSGRSKQKKEDISGSRQSLRRPSIPDELKGRDNMAFEASPIRQDLERGQTKSPKDKKKSPPTIKAPDVMQCIYTEKKGRSPRSPRPAREHKPKTDVDSNLAPPKAPVRRNRSTSQQRKHEKPKFDECDGREAKSPTSPKSSSQRDTQSGENNMNKSAGREVTWAKEIERGREGKRLDVPERPKRRRDESRSVERGEVRKNSASRESRETTKRESIIGTSKSDGSIKSFMKTQPIREGITLGKGKSLDSEKDGIIVSKDLPFPKRPSRRSRSRGGSTETKQRIPLAVETGKKESSQSVYEKCPKETLLSPDSAEKSVSPKQGKGTPLSPDGKTAWNIPTRPERRARRTDRKTKLKKSESSDVRLLHKPIFDDENAGLSKKTHSFESIELRITLDDDHQITEKDERKENIPESNIPSKSPKSPTKGKSPSPEVNHSGQALLQTTISSSEPPQIPQKPSKSQLKSELTLQTPHPCDRSPFPIPTTGLSPVPPQGESAKVPVGVTSPEITFSCIKPDFPERPPRKTKMKKMKVIEEKNDFNDVATVPIIQTNTDIVHLPRSIKSSTKNKHSLDRNPTEKSTGRGQCVVLPRASRKTSSKPPHSVKSTIEKAPVRAKHLSPKRLSPSSPLPPSRSPLLPIRSYSLDHSKLQTAAPKEKRSFTHHMNIKEISNMIEEITNKTMDRMRHPGFTSFPGLRKEASIDNKVKTKDLRRSPKVRKQKSESDMKALAVMKSESELEKRWLEPLSKTVSHSLLVPVSSPLVSPLTSTQASPITSPVASPITFEPLPEPKPRHKHAAKLARLHIPDTAIIPKSPEISPRMPPAEPSAQIEKSPIFHIQVVHPRAKISKVLMPSKQESRPPQTPPRSDSLPHTTGESVLTICERHDESEELSRASDGELIAIGGIGTDEDHLLIESGSLPQPKYRQSPLSSALSLSGDGARHSPQHEVSQPDKLCDSPAEVNVTKEEEKVIVTGRASPRPKYSPHLSAFRPNAGRSPRQSPEVVQVKKSPVVLHVGISEMVHITTSPRVSKFENFPDISVVSQSPQVSQVTKSTQLVQMHIVKSPEVSRVEKSEAKHVKSFDSPSATEIKLDIDAGKEEISTTGNSPRLVYKYSHVPSEKFTSKVDKTSSQRVSPQTEVPVEVTILDEPQPYSSVTPGTDEPQLMVKTDLETPLGEEQCGEHADSLTVSVGSPTGFQPTMTDTLLSSPGGTKPAMKPPYTLWGEDGWVRISSEQTDHHHPHFPNHTPPIGDKWDSRRGSMKSDSTLETDQNSSVEKRCDLRSESEIEPKTETDLGKVLEMEGGIIKDMSPALEYETKHKIDNSTTEKLKIPSTAPDETESQKVASNDKVDGIDQDSLMVKCDVFSIDESKLSLVAEEALSDEVIVVSSEVTESGPYLKVNTQGVTDSISLTSNDKNHIVDEETKPECQDFIKPSEATGSTKVLAYKPCDELKPALVEEAEYVLEADHTNLRDSEVDQEMEAKSECMDTEQVIAAEVEVIVSRYDGVFPTVTITESVCTEDKGIECDLIPESKDETTECDISSQEGSPSIQKRAITVPQADVSDTESLDDDVFETIKDEAKTDVFPVEKAKDIVKETDNGKVCESVLESCEDTLECNEETAKHHKEETAKTKMKGSPETNVEASTKILEEESAENKVEETIAEKEMKETTAGNKEVETMDNTGNESTDTKEEESADKNEIETTEDKEKVLAENKADITIEDKEDGPTEIKIKESAEDKDKETAENKERGTTVQKDYKTADNIQEETSGNDEIMAENEEVTVENKGAKIGDHIKQETTEKKEETIAENKEDETTAGSMEEETTAEREEKDIAGNQDKSVEHIEDAQEQKDLDSQDEDVGATLEKKDELNEEKEEQTTRVKVDIHSKKEDEIPDQNETISDIAMKRCGPQASSSDEKVFDSIDLTTRDLDENVTPDSNDNLIAKMSMVDNVKAESNVETLNSHPVIKEDKAISMHGDPDGVSIEGGKDLETHSQMGTLVGIGIKLADKIIDGSEISDVETVDKNLADIGSVSNSKAYTDNTVVIQSNDEIDTTMKAICIETSQNGPQSTSHTNSVIVESQIKDIIANGSEMADATSVQKDDAEIVVSKITSDNFYIEDVESGTLVGEVISLDSDNIPSDSLQDVGDVVVEEMKTWDEEVQVEDVELVPVTEESGVEYKPEAILNPSETEPDMPSVVVEETVTDPEIVELVTSETRV